MVKKRTQILDSGGLALPYFLFPQFFFVVCMGIQNLCWYLIRLKKCMNSVGLVFDHLEGKTLFGEIDFSNDHMV